MPEPKDQPAAKHTQNRSGGPLAGIKIVEFGSLGPGPFCAMLLSDMGADVIRIDRKGSGPHEAHEVTSRGRASLFLDLKKPDDVLTCFKLIDQADVLLEGFRPGVMERLGLGPEACMERNPRIIYGRLTGWGQTGPLAQKAGHDINYISLTGALHGIGIAGEKPAIPINLVGLHGGGALYMAMGICAALVEASRSGRGQVIDTAVTDGATSLMAYIFGEIAAGKWTEAHGTNLFDGGAHFYDVYETKDDKWISVGAIEHQFYAGLRKIVGLAGTMWDDHLDPSRWPDLKDKIAKLFKTRTRSDWVALAADADACLTPVLSVTETRNDPHHIARGSVVEVDGILQPNVAPRFSRTPGAIQGSAPQMATRLEEVLRGWGFNSEDVDKFRT